VFIVVQVKLYCIPSVVGIFVSSAGNVQLPVIPAAFNVMVGVTRFDTLNGANVDK